LNSNTSYSGHFEILDFDRESILRLGKIKPAGNANKRVVYFPNQVDALIKSFKDDNYKQLKKPDNTISVDRLGFTVDFNCLTAFN
jgi:hypothetical protein